MSGNAGRPPEPPPEPAAPDLERELRARTRELAELRTAHERTRRDLARREQDLAALRRQPIVRFALLGRGAYRRGRTALVELARTAARFPRRLLRRTRRLIDDRARRATPAQGAALLERLRSTAAPAARDAGPRVSIVMLNRDGAPLLARCLPALGATRYRDVELIVVDNASTDASLATIERQDLPFPVRVIRNDVNRRFAEACNQGAEVATGELILFLNNDIEPILPDWLGHMVETLVDGEPSTVAVGARLIYPRSEGRRRGWERHAELTLQHRGIQFDRAAGGVPMARPLGAGEDPCGPAATAVSEVVAATAACLLVRRSAFEAVGGFDPAFDYGLEDVDFCLRLVEAGGTIRYDGRTALWHHESATRVQAPHEVRRARVANNRRQLIDRWGPRLTRDALLDAIAGGGRVSTAPLHAGITLTKDDPSAGYGDWYTGHELGDALAGLGWRVSYLERYRDHWYDVPADLDVLISLIDAFDLRRIDRRIVTVAWVRNWPDRWRSRPWYDDHDLVLAGSAGLAAVLEADAAIPTRRMPIATNPARFRPVEPDPTLACDVLFVGNHFGGSRGVAAALPALAASGLRVRVHGRGWEDVPAMAPLAHGFLDYERLPAAYAAAGVVVDDTAHPTRPYGAVNSRLFDAVAAGAVVITDNAAGAREVFGVELPSWSDAADLEAGVRTLLADRSAAAARMAPARDAVLAGHTYAHRATEVRDHLVDWVRARRIGIRIGPPDWDVAPKWGDLHFGRALQKSLQRAGHPTRLHLLPDWDAEPAARDDATIHLFGLREARNRSGQVNLLWQISHPDLASGELYDTYDAAFVASDRFAAEIAPRTRTPVRPLHQATDPERFRPTDGGPRTELLYVANARRDRPVVKALNGTDRPLAVYGRGWTPDLLDPRHLRGEHVPNDELAAHYAAAAIVLNDHWADMRDWGFLSNRLYDALACGACVVSDRAPGLDEEFDGAVPTYADPDELVGLVDALLADPDRRRALGERGRAAVLARHTFEHRTAEILEVLAPLLAARPAGIVAAEPPGPDR